MAQNTDLGGQEHHARRRASSYWLGKRVAFARLRGANREGNEAGLGVELLRRRHGIIKLCPGQSALAPTACRRGGSQLKTLNPEDSISSQRLNPRRISRPPQPPPALFLGICHHYPIAEKFGGSNKIFCPGLPVGAEAVRPTSEGMSQACLSIKGHIAGNGVGSNKNRYERPPPLQSSGQTPRCSYLFFECFDERLEKRRLLSGPRDIKNDNAARILEPEILNFSVGRHHEQKTCDPDAAHHPGRCCAKTHMQSVNQN